MDKNSEFTEQQENLVIFPHFTDLFLHLSNQVNLIFSFPNNNIAIIFKDQTYDFWNLSPQKLINSSFFPYNYLTLAKTGQNSVFFISKDFQLYLLDLKSNKIEKKYDFPQETDDEENFLSSLITKSTINQLSQLFQLTYLENHKSLCVLLKNTLKEDNMNYILYIFQETNPIPQITNYSLKTIFLKIFNIQQEFMILFDLLHDHQKNPTMILWKNNPKSGKFEETLLKLNRWFTGTLITISLWSINEIVVFANLNGVSNPHLYIINLETGNMTLIKWNDINSENWLFYGFLTKNINKNVIVFQYLEFNEGYFIIIKNKNRIYKIESHMDETWDCSYDSESIIGYKNETKGLLIRILGFVTKKVCVLYLLEKTGILKKYGSLIAREILDFY